MQPALPQRKRPQATAEHFGIGVSTLWLWAKHRPGFPKPIKASPRVTLFNISAIDAFLTAQAAIAGEVSK